MNASNMAQSPNAYAADGRVVADAELITSLQEAVVALTAEVERLGIWSNDLAATVGDEWDDEEGQEAIVTGFVEYYSKFDRLINDLPYEGITDDIVHIAYHREEGLFSIVGVGPAAEAGASSGFPARPESETEVNR